MFSLTIVFGPSPTPFTLLFNSEENARKALNASTLIETHLILTDDFGQHAEVSRASIHGTMLEDMDKSKLAHIEQGLHRARTQANAQSRAQSDPVLKAAAMMSGAPMLSPMGNGAFRGQ